MLDSKIVSCVIDFGNHSMKRSARGIWTKRLHSCAEKRTRRTLSSLNLSF